MGPPDLYQIPKNNDAIISKMEVLGINKKSLNILAEMLKSFWTSRSKSRIWKIMPVQIIIYAVINWILCQSEWNYASQNRLTCYFQHRCSRYFFIYFKRDYIPNILAVLTSQFLGSEAPPPPPNLGLRSISCLDVYRRRISANWFGFAWNLHHTILLMSTNVWSENYEIWLKIKRENFTWR